jgi:hypothetical protein
MPVPAPGPDPYRPQSSRHQPTRSLSSEKLSQTQTEDDATMDDGDADARCYGYSTGPTAETMAATTRTPGPTRSPTDPASRSPVILDEKQTVDNGPGPPPDGGLRAWLIILGVCARYVSAQYPCPHAFPLAIQSPFCIQTHATSALSPVLAASQRAFEFCFTVPSSLPTGVF